MGTPYSANIRRLVKTYQPYKLDFDDRPVSITKQDSGYVAVRGRSIDTFDLYGEVRFRCPTKNKPFESNIVYINPHNYQIYLLCPLCMTSTKSRDWKAWHLVSDYKLRDAILDDLGLNLDKYKKRETEEAILSLVVDRPGINHYQISQELDMTPGRTRRGIARLKKKHLVRTRRVGKAICAYPILEEIGTDLTVSIGESQELIYF